ncbi:MULTISPECIES: 6-phosphogluconolactonase [Nocardioides]|uniref:6-phosphogluconolactonase n=1 Tax=Nocardioides vastitatis TaxID=2568655 RepID=A0ABW0ZFQ3_9ACTN|nr:6-phosphogluconolactonase [Nocardioides sp.]THI98580.1 6-phosphogluconolactonase [Nocardioides sp.]
MDNEPAPLVEVHDSPDALASAVAGELLNRIADAQAAGSVPHVCLTGGSIAEKIHREVLRHAPGSGVDWGAVEIWFGDERFVSADSPDRNVGQARAAFLDELGVPAHRIHQAPPTDGAGSVDESARAYAADVDERLVSRGEEFLVMILGVGPDGHVASLFPGFEQLSVTDVSAVGVSGSPKPPPERVSLTYPALNRSGAVWFVVSGEGKADAVARALASDGTVEDTPARGVRGRTETTWFLDTAAAARV